MNEDSRYLELKDGDKIRTLVPFSGIPKGSIFTVTNCHGESFEMKELDLSSDLCYTSLRWVALVGHFEKVEDFSKLRPVGSLLSSPSSSPKPKPKRLLTPLPERALRRFPSHHSDILILLAEDQDTARS